MGQTTKYQETKPPPHPLRNHWWTTAVENAGLLSKRNNPAQQQCGRPGWRPPITVSFSNLIIGRTETLICSGGQCSCRSWAFIPCENETETLYAISITGGTKPSTSHRFSSVGLGIVLPPSRSRGNLAWTHLSRRFSPDYCSSIIIVPFKMEIKAE